MFAELRQLRLFADLSEEDVEQLYQIKGERRADDPPKERLRLTSWIP